MNIISAVAEIVIWLQCVWVIHIRDLGCVMMDENKLHDLEEQSCNAPSSETVDYDVNEIKRPCVRICAVFASRVKVSS